MTTHQQEYVPMHCVVLLLIGHGGLEGGIALPVIVLLCGCTLAAGLEGDVKVFSCHFEVLACAEVIGRTEEVGSVAEIELEFVGFEDGDLLAILRDVRVKHAAVAQHADCNDRKESEVQSPHYERSCNSCSVGTKSQSPDVHLDPRLCLISINSKSKDEKECAVVQERRHKQTRKTILKDFRALV